MALETGSKAHYAFILPRYGEKVIGGAETLVRQIAMRLAARGDALRDGLDVSLHLVLLSLQLSQPFFKGRSFPQRCTHRLIFL